MKIMSKKVGFSAVAVMALVLTGCATDAGSPDAAGGATAADCVPAHEFGTIQDGLLQVAGMNELPGFLGLTDDGPFQGLNADLLPMFAEENCIEFKWFPMTGPAATLALTDEKIDVLAGIIIKNDARRAIFGEMKTEIYYESAGILSAKANNYTKIEELIGKKVGAVSGSNYIDPLMKAIGENNVVQFQASDAAYKDLAAGRIDAVITPSIPQGWYVKENADKGLVSNLAAEDSNYPALTMAYEIYWPHAMSNDALGVALTDFFERKKADGTVKKVLGEYGITADFYATGKK